MSTLDKSEKTTVPVSPTKVDNGEKDLKQQLEVATGEKEKLQQEVKYLELKLETRNKEMEGLKNENKDKRSFSELQKDYSDLQMKHAVLKLEQQVKLQFRFELVTACIHIFSLVVCILAFCQGWLKMHMDDMSSRNWWSCIVRYLRAWVGKHFMFVSSALIFYLLYSSLYLSTLYLLEKRVVRSFWFMFFLVYEEDLA